MLSINYDALHTQLTNKQIMPLGEHFSITDADDFIHCLRRCNEIIQSFDYHCVINAVINYQTRTKTPVILRVDPQVGFEMFTQQHILTARGTNYIHWHADLSMLFTDIICNYIQIVKK